MHNDAVWLGSGELRGFLGRLASAGESRPLVGLAHALASSEAAATVDELTLGVREQPDPVLVFSGLPDPEARERLADLPGLLAEAVDRFRPFTWQDVGDGVVRLAQRLTVRLGRDWVQGCRLVPVPRGGLIVGGLLSYAVGRDRMNAAQESRQALVVDDCSLTGMRLLETLADIDADDVAIALLCAHPGLTRAAESEPRVLACVTGIELHDHGPAVLGERYGVWQQQWAERMPTRLYTGLVDLVSFPWSQPSTRLWNSVTEQLEAGWRLAPPSICFKHRVAEPSVDVQVADDLPWFELLNDRVVPLRRPDALTLVRTGAESAQVRLAGTSLELFDAWTEARDLTTAASAVASKYAQPIARVRADLAELLRELWEHGYLAHDVDPQAGVTPTDRG